MEEIEYINSTLDNLEAITSHDEMKHFLTTVQNTNRFIIRSLDSVISSEVDTLLISDNLEKDATY